MRARCSVACSELLGWSLFRHAHVLQAAGDPAAFSSRTQCRVITNGMDPSSTPSSRDWCRGDVPRRAGLADVGLREPRSGRGP